MSMSVKTLIRVCQLKITRFQVEQRRALVHELVAQGLSVDAIARKFKVTRHTITNDLKKE